MIHNLEEKGNIRIKSAFLAETRNRITEEMVTMFLQMHHKTVSHIRCNYLGHVTQAGRTGVCGV